MFWEFFGHLRQWSDLFISLRKSSTVSGNRRYPSVASVMIWNCREMAENSLIKQNNIGLFGAVFASFWKQFTVSNNFLELVLKPKNEVSSVIEVPLFRPSFYLADNPQKVYNIHRAICLAYSCICSIRFKSEIQLFRLRIAENTIFFG